MQPSQCIQVSRHGQDGLLKFKVNIKMGEINVTLNPDLLLVSDGLVCVFQKLVIY